MKVLKVSPNRFRISYPEYVKIGKRKQIEYEIDLFGCWICVSHGTDTSGYPNIVIQGKLRLMHRWLFAHFKNKGSFLTSDQKLLHSCDNPKCINLNHLRIGTQADNIADMMRRKRNKPFVGVLHPRSKLTEQQVREIFQNNGESIAELAIKFTVCRAVIYDIKKRKTWKHLTA